ncbi:MAG: 3-isopropylmalate dehydrogenase [Gemmatimonadetes bacterium]|nr:3-isopropylmalate dehydrogenase [Gemmatimonadota bacterium]
MKLRIVSLPGDGVGPEVTRVALEVLRLVLERAGHELEVDQRLIGWAATQAEGEPLADATIAAALAADGVLLGAVGDPAADRLPPVRRPEAGILRLRSALGCYANLRPAKAYPPLVASSPLKADHVAGTDLVIVRELAGGLYYGRSREVGLGSRRKATDTETYTVNEIRRVAKVAFDLARTRRRVVTSVDKANVLSASRLWREVVIDVATEYPDVECSHMLVDRAAMELVLRSRSFDVILTSNLFGDILSDEAAGVVGSIGLLGSASLGGETAIYEPVHGSAPDLAGRDRANPFGAIVSVALMLRHSFQLEAEAVAVERALERVLVKGLRTADIAALHEAVVGTQAFGAAVLAALAGETGTVAAARSAG